MDLEIKLTITGLVYNQTVVGTYGLVLSEVTGNRRFSVMIGEPEAQSIALKMNNKKSPRPLTHDLIKSILNSFDAELIKVLIYDMINDVFYSELHIMKDEKLLIVDARTSDAVALALRFHCPIYTYEAIMSAAGIIMTEEEQENQTDFSTNPEDQDDFYPQQESLEEYTMAELEEMLERAVENEEYEKASQIRDEIRNRK